MFVFLFFIFHARLSCLYSNVHNICPVWITKCLPLPYTLNETKNDAALMKTITKNPTHWMTNPNPSTLTCVCAEIQQNERAFQKQYGINLNRKVKPGITKKKLLRRYRDIGLGFKTPRDVSFVCILYPFVYICITNK